MDGTDTRSEIVHAGLRNSSVNEGRNEVMLKGHICQMKEVFVLLLNFFFFSIKAKRNVCLFMLHSLTLWGRWGGAKERCGLIARGKSQNVHT